MSSTLWNYEVCSNFDCWFSTPSEKVWLVFDVDDRLTFLFERREPNKPTQENRVCNSGIPEKVSGRIPSPMPSRGSVSRKGTGVCFKISSGLDGYSILYDDNSGSWEIRLGR